MKLSLFKKIGVLLAGFVAVQANASTPTTLYVDDGDGRGTVNYSTSMAVKGKGWNWNTSTKTLELNGFDGVFVGAGGGDTLNISLKGSNKITTQQSLNADVRESTYGIKMDGHVCCQSTKYNVVLSGNESDGRDSLWIGQNGWSAAYWIGISANVVVKDVGLAIELVGNGPSLKGYGVEGAEVTVDGTASLKIDLSKADGNSGNGVTRLYAQTSNTIEIRTKGNINAVTDLVAQGVGSVLLSTSCKDDNECDNIAIHSSLFVEESAGDIEIDGKVRIFNPDYYSGLFIHSDKKIIAQNGKSCAFVPAEKIGGYVRYRLVDSDGVRVSHAIIKTEARSSNPLTFVDHPSVDMRDLEPGEPFNMDLSDRRYLHTLVSGGYGPYTFSVDEKFPLPAGLTIIQEDTYPKRSPIGIYTKRYAYISGTPTEGGSSGTARVCVKDGWAPPATACIDIDYDFTYYANSYITVNDGSQHYKSYGMKAGDNAKAVFELKGKYAMDYSLQSSTENLDWETESYGSLKREDVADGYPVIASITTGGMGNAGTIRYRVAIQKVNDDGTRTSPLVYSEVLTFNRFANVKATVEGAGSVYYTHNGVDSYSSDGINVVVSDPVSIVAVPGAGQVFAGWYNGSSLYSAASNNPLTQSAKALAGVNLTAKFISATDAKSKLNVYVDSYTHEGTVSTYTASNSPSVYEYNMGVDQFSVYIDASSSDPAVQGYKQSIYYQVKGENDADWIGVDENELPNAGLGGSIYIASDNGYSYKGSYNDATSKAFKLRNALDAAKGKSVQLRFAMYGSKKGTDTEITYSNPITFLVKHKVSVACLYNNNYKDCNESKASFVDENGDYYDNGSVTTDGIYLVRWYYTGETARIAVTPKFNYTLKEIARYKWDSFSSDDKVESFTDTLISVAVDGAKNYLTKFGDRSLMTKVVQSTPITAGANTLSFYAEGDQPLASVTLLKKGSGSAYETVDMEASDFVLAPGEYRLKIGLGFKTENDKTLAASCGTYDCSVYSRVDFMGWNATSEKLIRAWDLPKYKATDDVIYHYYEFTVEDRDFTVAFYNGGSTVGESQTVAFGGKATAIAAPEAETGYGFAGWYLSNGAKYDFDYAVTSDLELYANWIRTGYGAIEVSADRSTATIDGRSDEAAELDEDVVVSGDVTFNREFTAGKYATIMLPFATSASNIAGAKFYEFKDVKNGKVEVAEVTDIRANEAYIVVADADVSQLVVKGGVTMKKTEAVPVTSGNWQFVGTYEYKAWPAGDAEIGTAYGFAGKEGNSVAVGTFGKIAAGAYIYPMRGYLRYNAPAEKPAPAYAAATVSSAARAISVRAEIDLPDEMDVVIVGSGNDDRTVIGTLNTRTGEFRAHGADRWFDMKGRKLNGKPTVKGTYYKNGKVVNIK